MAHTYVLNYLHVVFTTKERANLIRPEWEDELHAYFGGIARNKKFSIDCSGGTEDHVHLLLRVPARIDLSSVMNALKANSSRWAGERDRVFAWQQGYSAFSVSYSGVPMVRSYIANQKRHHAKQSFEEEIRVLLRKHEVEFDEKYVFG